MENFHNPLEYNWSERKDSNLRPPAPKAGALTRLRYAPLFAKSLKEKWWSWGDSNPRPIPCEGIALPLRYSPVLGDGDHCSKAVPPCQV